MSQENWLEIFSQTLDAQPDDLHDRQHVLRGIAALQQGDVEAAKDAFRKAQRKDDGPFTAIATLALGECLRLEGKEGAALNTWKKITADPSAPPSSHYCAWLGIASLLQARGPSKELEQATARLDALHAELGLT